MNTLENFKGFEVEDLEIVDGGKWLETCWTDGIKTGQDMYDTSTRVLAYFE